MSRDDSKKTSGGRKKCENVRIFSLVKTKTLPVAREAQTRHDLFAFGFARDSSRTSSADSSAGL